jgi:hypothetical protein
LGDGSPAGEGFTTTEAGPPRGSDPGPEVKAAGVRQDRPAPEDGTAVQDEFQPFYVKEAKADARKAGLFTAVSWLLLVVLGLSLLGLAIDTYLQGLPFRLEATATAVICFALVGLLWKTTTLETRVGLEALAVSVVLAIGYVVHGHTDFGLWWLSAGYLMPIYYCLTLAAVLAAIWLTWPRVHWLPLVLTGLVLYSAYAPVFELLAGGASLTVFVQGPAFMEHWPIWLRSGWIMAQLILPFGAVLAAPAPGARPDGQAPEDALGLSLLGPGPGVGFRHRAGRTGIGRPAGEAQGGGLVSARRASHGG